MGETALVDTPAAYTPKYRRLTISDVGVLLKLHKDGLSQVEIAQRLGCSQPAVSEWVSKCTDSTDASKQYLRGQALRMARNIVTKGRAADHVATLKGLDVLSDEGVKGGVTVIVGGQDAQVQVNIIGTVSPSRSE